MATTTKKLRKGQTFIGFRVCPPAHPHHTRDFRHLVLCIETYYVCDAMDDVKDSLAYTDHSQQCALELAQHLREETRDTLYVRAQRETKIEITWQDDKDKRDCWYGGRIELSSADLHSVELLAKVVRKIGAPRTFCDDSFVRQYVAALIEKLGAIPVRYTRQTAMIDTEFSLDSAIPAPTPKEQPEAQAVA